jgi:hypothetical protein
MSGCSARTFSECWAQLVRRWGDQPDGKLDDYFDWLKPHLTDEQMRFATHVLYAKSEFFPKPQDFIDEAPRLEMPRLPEPELDVTPHDCIGCGLEITGPARKCFRCHLRDAGVERPDIYARAVEGPHPRRRRD